MTTSNGEYREFLWKCLITSGMTQYRLAELSGVGPTTLNRILNGRRGATETQVMRLALALVLSPRQKRFVNEHLDSAEYYTLPADSEGP